MILQQLMFTPKPRSVSDLSRFSNRDDISNIQYSLRKLAAAGLIEKVPGSTNRDTRYRPTERPGAHRSLVATRRERLIGPSANIADIEKQLRAATRRCRCSPDCTTTSPASSPAADVKA